MDDFKAVRDTDVILKELNGEAVLYSAKQRALHVLNPTAQLIWELCDGGHTPEEMEQALRARFAVSAAQDVMRDVQKTLEMFSTKGLLQPSA